MSRAKLLLLQILVAVVAIGLWYVLATYEIFGVTVLPPFFFSTPVDVADRIVRLFAGGTIWKHLWVTLSESMLAFAIGSIAGVLVGFWFARKPAFAAVSMRCPAWCWRRSSRCGSASASGPRSRWA
jgi:NitT/TauT family transport system permease protein